MPIYSQEPKTDSDFRTAPAGTHGAVCVDIIDLGVEELNFDGRVSFKHRIRFVWEIDEEDEDGKRYLVYSKKYVNSLHKNAALRKDLTAWRGKDFTASELERFDLEKVLNAPCILTIIHREHEGNTYANISAISPLAKGMKALKPNGDYVRRCDRDDWVEPSHEIPGKATAGGDGAAAEAEPANANDGLPF